MSNTDSGHIVNLSGSDKAIINLKVAGKDELEKASKLFEKLSTLANKALKNSKSPAGFFRILEYEVETFSEFTDFFDVTPVALAAGMVQMRFHQIAVDKWDDAGATINAKGELGGKYKLPPPTMIFVLRSKAYQKENGNIVMNDSLDKYGKYMAGINEIGYIYGDSEIEAIQKLEEHIPKKVLSKAVGAVTASLREAIGDDMVKLMKKCDYGTDESSSKEPEDVKREFAKQKVNKILSGLEGDDFFNTLGEVLRDDEMRNFIQEDFDEWRKTQTSEHVMPMPGEIHGEA